VKLLSSPVFAIPAAGYLGYQAGFFGTPLEAAEAAEAAVMPQGSPGQLSEDEEGGIDPKLTSAAVASPFISKASGAAGGPDPLKYLRKGARKAASSLLTPAGMVGLWGATGGVDPKSAIERAGVGAELAFAPELVRHAGKLTKPIKNKALRTVAERLALGLLTPTMAFRLARIASPIGWATLGAEGLYQLGKYAVKEQKRIKEMEPEQRKEFEAEQEEIGAFSAAEGGRVGFDKGSKPKSPGRRTFIKGITMAAALPIIGKYFKVGKFLSKAGAYTGPVIQKVKGMPEWLPSLVKRLWNEGEDVTKTASTMDRQVVKRGTLESGDDVDLIYDVGTGNVSIDVTPKKKWGNTESGAFNKEYGLELTKGEEIATKKGSIKTKDKFSVNESQPIRTGHPEDPDWDWDWSQTTVDDAITDLTELEAFAKNKSTKQIYKKKGIKKKDVNPEVEFDDTYDLDYDID